MTETDAQTIHPTAVATSSAKSATEQVLLANGIAVAVYQCRHLDSSQPTVLLLHGWPDSAEVWTPVVAILSEQFNVVTYDMRGVGGSTHAQGPKPYRVEALASELEAVIKAVSPESRVHLVGHDWGSVIGWEAVMTSAISARLASFTSLSGPNLDQVGEITRQAWRRGPSNKNARSAALAQSGKSYYTWVLSLPVIRNLGWRIGGARLFRWWLRRSEGISGYPGSDVAHNAIASVPLYRSNILRKVTRPNLRPVEIPVQLIIAQRDRYVSPRMLELTDVPDLTKSYLDAGHWSPRSHPAEVADLITKFVEVNCNEGASK